MPPLASSSTWVTKTPQTTPLKEQLRKGVSERVRGCMRIVVLVASTLLFQKKKKKQKTIAVAHPSPPLHHSSEKGA